MRKTRLVILPGVRSITQIGCLLLFLACPTIAFKGQERRDIEPICKFHELKYWWLPFDTGESNISDKWTEFQQCQFEEFKEMIKVRNKTNDCKQGVRNENVTSKLQNAKTIDEFSDSKLINTNLTSTINRLRKNKPLKSSKKQNVWNTNLYNPRNSRKLCALIRYTKGTTHQCNVRHYTQHYNYLSQKETDLFFCKSMEKKSIFEKRYIRKNQLQHEIETKTGLNVNKRSEGNNPAVTSNPIRQIKPYQYILERREAIGHQDNQRTSDKSWFQVFPERRLSISQRRITKLNNVERNIYERRDLSNKQMHFLSKIQPVIPLEAEITISERNALKVTRLTDNEYKKASLSDSFRRRNDEKRYKFSLHYKIGRLTRKYPDDDRTEESMRKQQQSNIEKRTCDRRQSVVFSERREAIPESRVLDQNGDYNNIQERRTSDVVKRIPDRRGFIISSGRTFTISEVNRVQRYIHERREPFDEIRRSSERRLSVPSSEHRYGNHQKGTVGLNGIRSKIREQGRLSDIEQSTIDRNIRMRTSEVNSLLIDTRKAREMYVTGQYLSDRRAYIVSSRRTVATLDKRTSEVNRIHKNTYHPKEKSNVGLHKFDKRRSANFLERIVIIPSRRNLELNGFHGIITERRDLEGSDRRLCVVSSECIVTILQRRNSKVRRYKRSIPDGREPSKVEHRISDSSWSIASERIATLPETKKLELNGLHNDMGQRAEQLAIKQPLSAIRQCITSSERRVAIFEKRTLAHKNFRERREPSDREQTTTDRRHLGVFIERRVCIPGRTTFEVNILQRNGAGRRELSVTEQRTIDRRRFLVSSERIVVIPEWRIFEVNRYQRETRKRREPSSIEQRTYDKRLYFDYREHKNTMLVRTPEFTRYHRCINDRRGPSSIEQPITDRERSVASSEPRVGIVGRKTNEEKKLHRDTRERRETSDVEQRLTDRRWFTGYSAGTVSASERRTLGLNGYSNNVRERRDPTVTEQRTIFRRHSVVSFETITAITARRMYEMNKLQRNLEQRMVVGKRWSIASFESKVTLPEIKNLKMKGLNNNIKERTETSEVEQRTTARGQSPGFFERKVAVAESRTSEANKLQRDVQERRKRSDIKQHTIDRRRSIVSPKRTAAISERTTFEKNSLQRDIWERRQLFGLEQSINVNRQSVLYSEYKNAMLDRRTNEFNKQQVYINKQRIQSEVKLYSVEIRYSFGFSAYSVITPERGIKGLNGPHNPSIKRREPTDKKKRIIERDRYVTSLESRVNIDEKRTYEMKILYRYIREQRETTDLVQQISHRRQFVAYSALTHSTPEKRTLGLDIRLHNNMRERREPYDTKQSTSDRRSVFTLEPIVYIARRKASDKIFQRNSRGQLYEKQRTADRRWYFITSERRAAVSEKRTPVVNRFQRDVRERRQLSDLEQRTTLRRQSVVYSDNANAMHDGRTSEFTRQQGYIRERREPSDLKLHESDRRRTVVSLEFKVNIPGRRTNEVMRLQRDAREGRETSRVEQGLTCVRESTSHERMFFKPERRISVVNEILANIHGKREASEMEKRTNVRRRSVQQNRSPDRIYQVITKQRIIRERGKIYNLEQGAFDRRRSVVYSEYRGAILERRTSEVNRIQKEIGERRKLSVIERYERGTVYRLQKNLLRGRSYSSDYRLLLFGASLLLRSEPNYISFGRETWTKNSNTLERIHSSGPKVPSIVRLLLKIRTVQRGKASSDKKVLLGIHRSVPVIREAVSLIKSVKDKLLERVVHDQNLILRNNIEKERPALSSQSYTLDRENLIVNEYHLRKSTLQQPIPSRAWSIVTYKHADVTSEIPSSKVDQQDVNGSMYAILLPSWIGNTFSTINLAVIGTSAIKYFIYKNSVLFNLAKHLADLFYSYQQLNMSWPDFKVKNEETGPRLIQALLSSSVFSTYAITCMRYKQRVYKNFVSIF